MSDDADFELLLRYVHDDVSNTERISVESRLEQEPHLNELLYEISREEVLLRRWARDCTAGEVVVENARTIDQEQESQRNWQLALTACLILIPPLLIVAFGNLMRDEGLGAAARAMAHQRHIELATGALSCLVICCWFGFRNLGLTQHPWLYAIGTGTTSVITMLMCQAAMTEQVVTERDKLASLFQNERWVSYDSAYYWPADLPAAVEHAAQEPTEQQIRDELKLLRRAGFTAIYLHEYRDGQRDVPRLAREAGFRGVVVSIRVGDPRNLSAPDTRKQVENAVAAAPFVDAYCFGELTAREVNLTALKERLGELRMRTKKPVTTSFLDDEYFGRRGEPLRSLADFTVRGLHHQWNRRPGVDDELAGVRAALASFHDDDLPSLLTFVGFPSAGDERWTPETQKTYFEGVRDLRKPVGTNVVHFTSFDQPWDQRRSRVANDGLHCGRFGLFEVDSESQPPTVVFRPKPSVELFAPKSP